MIHRQHSSYKEVPIPWIVSLPTHWEHVPLFAASIECNLKNKGMIENNLLSLSYGRIIKKDINSGEGLLPESFETYQIVEKNDIVFRLTDLQNDKRSLRSAIVNERGIITSAYIAIRTTGLRPAFMNYLMRAYDVQKVFYSMGGGLRQSLKFDDLRRLILTRPPSSEQDEICAYLDRETSRIDTLITKKAKFIELLKEKRQAVITKVVTNGLDDSVPQKDSGIEWIGKIPAHWVVKPLFSLVQEIKSKNKGMLENNLLSLSYGRIVQRDINASEGLLPESFETYQIVDPNDIVFRLTDLQNDQKSLRTAIVKERGIITSAYVVARAAAEVHPDFLNHLLRAYDSRKVFYSMGGGMRQSMKYSDLRRMPLLIPPLAEQEEICSYLCKKTLRVEALMKKTERSIELLKEHRSALITAAVTGKIDVRVTK